MIIYDNVEEEKGALCKVKLLSILNVEPPIIIGKQRYSIKLIKVKVEESNDNDFEVGNTYKVKKRFKYDKSDYYEDYDYETNNFLKDNFIKVNGIEIY